MKTNLWILSVLLLCFCVSAWGGCRNVNFENPNWCRACPTCSERGVRYYVVDYYDSGNCQNKCGSGSSAIVDEPCYYGGEWYTGMFLRGTQCRNNMTGLPCGDGYGSQFEQFYGYNLACSTQADVDSVVITQKCTTGTVSDSTIGGDTQWFCRNGTGLIIGFWDFSANTHSSSIKYYIHTSTGYEELDEGTYNHLAAQVCADVGLMRGVLNGKYVYWYSNEPEPTGVVNRVRIK